MHKESIARALYAAGFVPDSKMIDEGTYFQDGADKYFIPALEHIVMLITDCRITKLGNIYRVSGRRETDLVRLYIRDVELYSAVARLYIQTKKTGKIKV